MEKKYEEDSIRNRHKKKYRIRLLIEIGRQTIQIFLEFGVGGHSISVQVLIPTDS